MSFQNVRKGHQVYVLYKDGEPRLENGVVVMATSPVAKYGVQPVPMQFAPEMVMDLSVECGGNTYNFPQIPAGREIVDYGNGNVVLACTKEAMNAEVESMMQRSQEVIGMVDYHKKVVERCAVIMEGLNPDRAERRRQERENQELRRELADMKDMLARYLADSGVAKEECNKMRKE